MKNKLLALLSPIAVCSVLMLITLGGILINLNNEVGYGRLFVDLIAGLLLTGFIYYALSKEDSIYGKLVISILTYTAVIFVILFDVVGIKL